MVALYIELRKDRQSAFLFVPRHMPFLTLAQLIFYEFFSRELSDTVLVQSVLSDLQSRGIVHKNAAVIYHTYSLRTLTFHDVYLRTSDNQIFCRGTSIDKMEAYAKAFGEVFERTTLKYPPVHPDERTTSRSLKGSKQGFVSPDAFARPTVAQSQAFPSFRIDDTDVFAWTRVAHVGTDSTVLIPSQTVFYGTHTRYTEKAIIQQSTHGAGASFSAEGAFRSGLLEIVHRHFFLKAWYKGGEFPQLDVSTIPTESAVAVLLSELDERGFKAHFLDCTNEAGLPSVICLLERGGGMYCGGSCSTQMLSALNRSLSEAFATYLWVQQSKIRGEYALTQSVIDSIHTGFVDASMKAHRRVHLYGNSYFVSKYANDVLASSSRTVYRTTFDVSDTFSASSYAIETFPDVYHYRCPHPILSEYGYHAARVIVPQSYFFALDEKYSRPVLKDGVQPVRIIINPFP